MVDGGDEVVGFFHVMIIVGSYTTIGTDGASQLVGGAGSEENHSLQVWRTMWLRCLYSRGLDLFSVNLLVFWLGNNKGILRWTGRFGRTIQISLVMTLFYLTDHVEVEAGIHGG